VLRGDQLRRVAERIQFPRPVMRPGAGLDAHGRTGQVGEKRKHLSAGELFLEHDLAVFRQPHRHEHVLGNIQSDHRCVSIHLGLHLLKV